MLYFVRHGQTDWNREPTRCQGWVDVPLNETGRRQARQEGLRLRSAGIGRIVSSHLLRAVQTAEIIREQLGRDVPLDLDERLAESRRGAWEARLFSEIMAEDPKAWQHYREHPETFCFPEGESLAGQQRRVLAAVRDAAERRCDTLLVTHGGSVRLLRAFLQETSIGAFHVMSVPNGQILEVPGEGLVERIDAFLAEPGQRMSPHE